MKRSLQTSRRHLRLTTSGSYLPVVLLLCLIVPNVRAAITVVGSQSASVSAEITFVGAGSAATATSGNVTPGLPAGTAMNDILICVVESRDNVVTSMTNWTLLNGADSGTGHHASLFWRRATGVDPTIVTHTAGAGIGAQIMAFRGVSTTTAFDVANSFTVSPADNNTEAAAITTGSANTMLVFTQHVADNYSAAGTPTGSSPWTSAFFTEYDPSGQNNDLTISAQYGLRGTVGTQPALQVGFTPTSGRSGISHGAQLALRPANNITSMAINVPAGTATDDVMIAAIALKSSTVTINPPSGWTLLNRVNQSTGDSNAQAIYYRVVTGTEPASYTWNFSPAVFGAVGGIVTYRGVSTSSPINVNGGNVTASSTTHTATGVTTTVSNTMIVTAHSFASSASWTPPVGMTERVDKATLTVSNEGGIALEISDVLQTGAGATGDKTATASGNADTGVAQILALKAAPANYHYAISFPNGNTGSACTQPVVKIDAHDNTHNSVNVAAGTILFFTTSDGLGIWGPAGTSPLSGTGVWAPSGNDDGIATYTWPGGQSSMQVNLAHITTTGVYINLSDGSATDVGNGTSEDGSLVFTIAPVIRITSDGTSLSTVATQIAGKPSNQGPGQTLYIQLKQSGVTAGGRDGCEVPGDYSGVNTVTVALECVNPTTCAGQQATVNGTTIAISHHYAYGTVPAPLVGTSVSFNFDGSGDVTNDNKAPLVFSYPDVGRVKLYFSMTMDPSGPTSQTPLLTFNGSTNAFVSRPFGFYVQATGNPAASGASGTVFKKAGENFTVTARAVQWQAADDDGVPSGVAGDGIPDGHESADTAPGNNTDLSDNPPVPNFGKSTSGEYILLSARLDQPAGGTDPGLTGGTSISSFTNGGGSTTSAHYDEAGIMEIAAKVGDGDYLAIGATETAKISGKTGYVGRFIPDHFAIASNSPGLQNDCAAGSYTYMDKNFYFATPPILTVTALNKIGVTTNNYGGGFWHLSSSLSARTYIDQVAGTDHSFSASAVSVVTLGGQTDYDGAGTLATSAGTSGDIFRYGRVNLKAPFAAKINLNFTTADLTDSDGVCYDANADGTCDGFTISNIGGASMRFGRLKIGSEASSESVGLTAVPMLNAEYYNGTGFVTNTNDVCTGISATQLTLSSPYEHAETDANVKICEAGGTTTMTVTNNPFVSGQGLLSFTPPGPACTGAADILIDLSTLNLSHLHYDWDDADGLHNGPYDSNPQGRVSFGIISRPKEVIYTREPWN